MSTTWKVVIGVVIVVLIGTAAYFWSTEKASAPQDTAALPTGNSTTDDSLDKDMQSMDAQINAFTSDNAAIDSGLNDQQVEQDSL